MRIFLDSGNLNEINHYYHDMPWLAGVTTTPAILKRDGGNMHALLPKEAVPEVHTEVLGLSPETMRESIEQQLKEAGDLSHKLVFKIPFCWEALSVVHEYRKRNVRFNMHCVNTLAQLIAISALEKQPDYICLMAGKTEDQGYDVRPLIKAAGNIVWNSEIMLSSFRGVGHYRLCDEESLSCITVPPKVLDGIFDNDLTYSNRQAIGA